MLSEGPPEAPLLDGALLPDEVEDPLAIWWELSRRGRFEDRLEVALDPEPPAGGQHRRGGLEQRACVVLAEPPGEAEVYFRKDRRRFLYAQYRPHGIDLGAVCQLENDPLHLARSEGHDNELSGARLHPLGERVAEGPVVPRRSVHRNFGESVPFRQVRTSAAVYD